MFVEDTGCGVDDFVAGGGGAGASVVVAATAGAVTEGGAVVPCTPESVPELRDSKPDPPATAVPLPDPFCELEQAATRASGTSKTAMSGLAAMRPP